MLKIVPSNQFRKDLKLANKRGFDLKKLKNVIDDLSNEIPLAEKHKDHSLTGNYKGLRECHVEPDWLLIYKVENEELELFLFRTGTHSDLF